MKSLILGLILLPGIIFAGPIRSIDISRETGYRLESTPNFKCEYYKNQATTFCRSNYSDYDARQDCSNVYKERWCRCIGSLPDCYKKEPFYW